MAQQRVVARKRSLSGLAAKARPVVGHHLDQCQHDVDDLSGGLVDQLDGAAVGAQVIQRSGLEVGDGADWSGWARSHFFMVCWKRSTLPWVCACQGRPFFWTTPRRRSSVSRWLRPSLPPVAGGQHHAVVGQCRGRTPVFGNGCRELGVHDRAGDAVWAVIRRANREQSSSQDKISVSRPGRLAELEADLQGGAS